MKSETRGMGLSLDNVTKKTNLLVFGYQDATKLTPDPYLVNTKRHLT